MNRAYSHLLTVGLVWSSIVLCLAVSLGADEPDRQASNSSDKRDFFEKRIRPVLVNHCYECHSADSDDLGARLRLDFRDGLLAGGESGPAVVPGQPEASLLLHALRYDGLEMPPDKPLPAAVVNDFERWIAGGAVDPRAKPTTPAGDQTDHAADETGATREHWAFDPIIAPDLPNVKARAWPDRALDRFVLAELEAEGITPARDASPRTLLRRLSYDLTGLPPTHQEIEAFERAFEVDRRRAIERWVDRLLARPEFGERWGRHWLDVARYAESNGNDGLGRNPTFPHAWRYRDYVIDAFNSDLPYDRFLTEQIAGDLLPAKSATQADRQKIATGFLALAAKPAKAMNNNFAMDVVADQLDVIGIGVMGLSVGCARCHDHKFDPIPTKDYYALAGIFTSTETMWGLAGNEKLTAPPTDLHVLRAAPANPPPEDFVETVILRESATGKPKNIPKPEWDSETPLAMGVRDKKKVADCKVNLKGDAKKLGAAVPRGFLSAIPVSPSSISIPADQSGRLQLAKWLTDPNHPLTARVIVNRIWGHLFGQAIVRTPNDFGIYGQRPTHPRLLDHLASRLIQSGWSIKSLIREIVTSRTYQLTSLVSPDEFERDPDNRLLARHDRRRLDAESLRDSMLRASGHLNLARPDGSIIQHRDILVNLAGSLHQPSNHRSVYLCYLRSSPPPELAAFDLPDFTTVVGQRETSTVPSQSLHLFNSSFVMEQADRLGRVLCSRHRDSRQRVVAAFRAALQRQPSDSEIAASLQWLQSAKQRLDCERELWTSFSQMLLMTNEFRYVD